MRALRSIVIITALMAGLALFATNRDPLGSEFSEREDFPQILSLRTEYPLHQAQYRWVDSAWLIQRDNAYTYSSSDPRISLIETSYYQGSVIGRHQSDHYFENQENLQYVAHLDSLGGNINYLDDYVYNSQDQLVQICYYHNWQSPDNPGTLWNRTDFEYTAQGWLSGEYHYNVYPDFEYVHDQTLYYYNAQGQLVMDVHSWCNDDFYLESSHIQEYNYNADGTLNELWSYNAAAGPNAPTAMKSLHFYDGSGWLIRRDNYQIPISGGTEFELVSANFYANDPWGRQVEDLFKYYNSGEWSNWELVQTMYLPSATDDPELPVVTRISCHPNPFSGELQIDLEQKEAGTCRVEIFNLRGQRVRTLLNGVLAKGSHTLVWDGLDDAGQDCPGGVYLLRSESSQGKASRKVLRL